MRRWHVVFEADVAGQDTPGEVDAFTDRLMDFLVDAVDDATLGGSLALGTVEIEFELDAATMEEAQALARDVVRRAVAASGGQFDPFRELTERVLEAV